MTARLRKFLSDLGDTFWLVPALIIFAALASAAALVNVDRAGVPSFLLNQPWIYNGGGTGARTLLGAVAGSTISVAGTVFSITIAALSLAAGQMGPRLLRNFTRDRLSQTTLGVFLGTFAYSLIVLRSVRTQEEGAFVPHLALSVAVLLALICVALLIFFVNHIASRINVDTVIELVGDDMNAAFERLTCPDKGHPLPTAASWSAGVPVCDKRSGYLQQFDGSGLADWAHEHRACIKMLVRPGDYVFPGVPVALVCPRVEGADNAIRNATALGAERVSSADLEFAIRQLVEVAVRALSSGVSDPNTVISVLNRLGAALCSLRDRHLPTGVHLREETPVLVAPMPDYDGVVDSMFHMIRQNCAGQPSIVLRMLEVMIAVASCDRDPDRRRALRRHADLVMEDAERDVATTEDLEEIRRRRQTFEVICREGPEAIAKGDR